MLNIYQDIKKGFGNYSAACRLFFSVYLCDVDAGAFAWLLSAQSLLWLAFVVAALVVVAGTYTRLLFYATVIAGLHLHLFLFSFPLRLSHYCKLIAAASLSTHAHKDLRALADTLKLAHRYTRSQTEEDISQAVSNSLWQKLPVRGSGKESHS